ncbi:MAG: hypothetical protein GY754_23485 [bacterium]|nr:hypothetical protein [bacterium]
MKRGLLFLLILLFTTTYCSGCFKRNGTTVKRGFLHFKVSIEQDGLTKDIENNEVELLKKPFSIVIHFPEPDSVFVNASFEPGSFMAAFEGKKVEEVVGFEGKGMAEELFNKEETLMLSNSSPNFWQYASANEHRFSDVITKEGVYICKRNVSHIINVDNDNEKITVSNLKGNALYLVIMKMEWNEDYTQKIEKKREFIKISFKEMMFKEEKNSGVRLPDDSGRNKYTL